MTNPTSLLFKHAVIITVDAARTIWLDGAILIHGNRIAAIGTTSSIIDQNPLSPDTTIVHCGGGIIIPGLINTHAHVCQSILRGLAEDLPLHSWLCDAVWPLEAHFERDDGYVAARLAIAEMLRTGTTCFLEALLTPRSGIDNVARAVKETGIRGCLGKLVKAEESSNRHSLLADPRDRDLHDMSIDAALDAHTQYHNSCEGRLQVWMAAGTPRGSPEAAHLAIGNACVEHGLGLTMHCAEAPKDLEIFRDNYGCTPAEFCRRTNLIGKGRRTVLAHMVNLDVAIDLPILRETGAAVAHNPSSNCKLASGIAAVPEMLDAQVNVGLGTDGAPCANTYDMIVEMRIAALLQRGSRRDATTMAADEVLAMATINGARALGLDREIGSLEIGKKADLVLIDVSSLSCAPFNASQVEEGGMDPVTAAVFSCTGADVESVVIDGHMLVENKTLLCVDERQIRKDAQRSIRGIRERSGIGSRQKRSYR